MTLAVSGLCKRFGQLEVLRRIGLEVSTGEFVCFLGPSGCGKTTLLRIIAGLEFADEGSVLLNGRDLAGVPARRRNFGMVFQSYALFPNMTAAGNVAYGLACRGVGGEAAERRVAEMLRLVGLEGHAGHYPSQLSGGQQQRVALARALAPAPAVLLLDEPLSALDAKVREGLRGEIRELQRRLGITTIMVTHDQDEALSMADRIMVMREGTIDQIGRPADIYDRPATRFVASFIGRMNLLTPDTDAQGRPTLAGRPIELGAEAAGASALGIRPEAVRLHPPEASEGANRLPGRVQRVQFLGNVSHLEVSLDGEAGPSLLAELHGRGELPEVGQPVTVELPARDLLGLA